MPLAFFILPFIKLLSPRKLGEEDCQDNENELFCHNNLHTAFSALGLGLFTFFHLVVAGRSRWPCDALKPNKKGSKPYAVNLK